MAEDGKNKASVETKQMNGMQVRTYKVSDGSDTLIKIKSETEEQQDIAEYEQRMQEQANRRAEERQKKFEQQLKNDLGDASFDYDEVELAKAAEKLKIDPQEISQRLAELTKDQHIFCIGDSITYGFEVEGSQTWIGRLRKEDEINLINVGLNGNTTADMLDRFHEHVLEYRPKAVFIMGGGNDIMGGTPIEYVTNNIAMMTQMALDRGIIPMVGITPEPFHRDLPEELKAFVDYEQVKTNLAALKEWIKAFAEANNLPIIDFDTEMKNRLRTGYSRYFFDGIHPNPSGHKIMAMIARDAFVEMGLLEKKEDKAEKRFSGMFEL